MIESTSNIIPPEYKCSRCKKDLRDNVPDDKKCICIKSHKISASKSGNNFQHKELEYDGYGYNR